MENRCIFYFPFCAESETNNRYTDSVGPDSGPCSVQLVYERGFLWQNSVVTIAVELQGQGFVADDDVVQYTRLQAGLMHVVGLAALNLHSTLSRSQ